MTIKLLIELPEELGQQLMAEAKKLNVSVESLVLRSLAQSFNQGTAGSDNAIAQMLACIREAQLAKNSTVTVPATQITLSLAQVMKVRGLIADFQEINDEVTKHLLIYLNTNDKNDNINQITKDQLDWQSLELPKELVTLLSDLENKNSAVRAQAVITLGQFYSKSTR